jgi:hypothetical protein
MALSSLLMPSRTGAGSTTQRRSSSPRIALAWQNAWIESFNGRLRDEHLNSQLFDSLLEAQSSSGTGASTTTSIVRTARTAGKYRPSSQGMDQHPPNPSRIATWFRIRGVDQLLGSGHRDLCARLPIQVLCVGSHSDDALLSPLANDPTD